MNITLPGQLNNSTPAAFALSEDGLMVTTQDRRRKTYFNGGFKQIPVDAVKLRVGEYSANRYCDMYIWRDAEDDLVLTAHLPRGLNARWYIIAYGEVCAQITDLFPVEIREQIPFL